MKKNISFIGMMGCGKTTIGKELSSLYDYNFIDLDDEIVKKEQQEIKNIFDLRGEKYFRNIEKILLKKITSSEEGYILSCGGGVVLDQENLALLKEKTSVIWLKADSNIIYERLKLDKTRPLLKSISIEKIEDILQKRKNLYIMADYVIDTNSNDLELIIKELKKCLKLL